MAPPTEPSLAGERVLLTGASGLIGQHLDRALRQRGALVTRLPGRAAALPPDEERRLVEVAAPSVVVHAAAETRPDATETAYHAGNVELTARLLDAAASCPPPVRFLHVGTCGEYGSGPTPLREDAPCRPASAYPRSKLEATELVLRRGTPELPVTVVRPFLTFGPGQRGARLLPRLFEAAVTGEALSLTSGEQERDFVFVDDVAGAILDLAACPGAAGRIVNVASGVPTTVRDLVALVEEEAGIPRGASPFRLGELPYREDEPFRFYADVTLLERLTGRRPSTPLREAVRATLAWHRHEHASPSEARP